MHFLFPSISREHADDIAGIVARLEEKVKSGALEMEASKPTRKRAAPSGQAVHSEEEEEEAGQKEAEANAEA